MIYGSNPTQIFRIDPDGYATIIAGTGNADPQTDRQVGDALELNISQWALALTENGNLLFASGHVVYDLLDPAHAPGIASAS